MTTTSNITSTSNMNSLRVINDFLDDHFNKNFNNIYDSSYLASFKTKKLALDCVEETYETFYNSESDLTMCGLSEIKGLCNFDMVIGMCAYVYDQCGMTLELSHFNDNDRLLRLYIAFYMKNTHQEKFIQEIDGYGFCENSEGELSDDDGEADVEEFEFEGTTYLKDDDDNIYKNDLANVEQVGKWDNEKKCVVFKKEE